MLEENSWQIQHAKAHFSELIRRVSSDGVQKITKQGQDVAIIISIDQYQKLLKSGDSLTQFFMKSPYPDFDLELTRSKDLPREFET